MTLYFTKDFQNFVIVFFVKVYSFSRKTNLNLAFYHFIRLTRKSGICTKTRVTNKILYLCKIKLRNYYFGKQFNNFRVSTVFGFKLVDLKYF